MENIQPIKIKPKFVAQVCPNCNGRGTVGYDKRPCPTCGDTDHRGVILIPVEGGTDDNEDNLY